MSCPAWPVALNLTNIYERQTGIIRSGKRILCYLYKVQNAHLYTRCFREPTPLLGMNHVLYYPNSQHPIAGRGFWTVHLLCRIVRMSCGTAYPETVIAGHCDSPALIIILHTCKPSWYILTMLHLQCFLLKTLNDFPGD